MRKLRMGLEGDVGEQLQFGENLDDGIVEEKDEEQPPFEDPFSSLLAEGPQSTSQQVLPAAPPLSQQPKVKCFEALLVPLFLKWNSSLSQAAAIE